MSAPTLPDIDLSWPKIFVTGLYGTGKSTTASLIAQSTGHRLLNFDDLWSYPRSAGPSQDQHVREHFSKLGNRFVIDAIGFNSRPDLYRAFNSFYMEHEGEILIVCTLCLSIEVWMKRLAKKKLVTRLNVENYIEFHTTLLPLHSGKNIIHYDTVAGKCVEPADVEKFIQGMRS